MDKEDTQIKETKVDIEESIPLETNLELELGKPEDIGNAVEKVAALGT